MESIEPEVLVEWVAVSAFLSWFILIVSAVTVPLLIASLCSVQKRCQYYPFLAGIVIGNTVMLLTMSGNLILEQNFEGTSGYFICKATSFTTGVSACFVNWTWVVMYVQRCVHVLCPLRRQKNDLVADSRKLLILVGILSCLTQIWTPILITENVVTVNGTEGVYCGQDHSMEGSVLFQTIAIMESMFTFIFPFLLTVFTDISVFFCHSNRFTLISIESLNGTDRSCDRTKLKSEEDTRPEALYMKIMSQKCILSSRRRRLFAIRRCLIMATLNLSLNLPHFAFQIIDEFFPLRHGDNVMSTLLYLKADAIVYVIYLLQFPLVPMFVYALKSDWDGALYGRKQTASAQRSSQPLIAKSSV